MHIEEPRDRNPEQAGHPERGDPRRQPVPVADHSGQFSHPKPDTVDERARRQHERDRRRQDSVIAAIGPILRRQRLGGLINEYERGPVARGTDLSTGRRRGNAFEDQTERLAKTGRLR